MAISLLDHKIAQGNTLTATTASFDSSGATLIVIGISSFQSNPAAASDNKGNTWSPLTAQSLSASCHMRLYYCVNPTVGSGHTFTASHASACYPTVGVRAYTSGGVFDLESGTDNSGGGASTTLVLGTSFTPSVNNCVAVSGCAWGDVTSAGTSTYFTNMDQMPLVSAQSFGLIMGDVVQTTASAISGGANALWGWTSSVIAGTRIASFKEAVSVSVIKTFLGLANASTKTVIGLANASVKKFDGVANS